MALPTDARDELIDQQAGWYCIGDTQERYWDGERWTDAYRHTEQPVAPDAVPPAKKSGKGRNALAWLLGGVIFLGVASCLGSNREKNTGPDEYDYQATCKQLVRESLKNPSTADFMDEQQSASSASGTVVAENTFGGKVTSSYRCTVSTTGLVTLVQRPE